MKEFQYPSINQERDIPRCALCSPPRRSIFMETYVHTFIRDIDAALKLNRDLHRGAPGIKIDGTLIYPAFTSRQKGMPGYRGSGVRGWMQRILDSPDCISPMELLAFHIHRQVRHLRLSLHSFSKKNSCCRTARTRSQVHSVDVGHTSLSTKYVRG